MPIATHLDTLTELYFSVILTINTFIDKLSILINMELYQF